jgi:hypothetical protein
LLAVIRHVAAEVVGAVVGGAVAETHFLPVVAVLGAALADFSLPPPLD